MLDRLTNAAMNDATYGAASRERTVPIPQTITPVPGYPRKLVVFKIAASRFWQVRCWIAGKTYRRSTQSQSLRVAQSFARRFYEQLLAQAHGLYPALPTTHFLQNTAADAPKPALTFAALAAQMMANEMARVERGEFSAGSYQVLQNRLDAHILPRWGQQTPQQITHEELLAFTQYLSKSLSSITVSQYMVAVRKVLTLAFKNGHLQQLPEFPKIKIVTTPRGAFTPSEYWQIIRRARQLVGKRHPDTANNLRRHYKLRTAEYKMPPDVAWAIGFMVNSFIRPSDLKTLRHRHVEVVRNGSIYLRLTLPETKKHSKPIVTLQPAVRIYLQILKHQQQLDLAGKDDYLFLPQLRDRNYAHSVLAFYFNWVLEQTGLKAGAHGQSRTLYSLRHSAITFRLLYGQGIDLLTLARNARTSVEVINDHYASTVCGEQNIALLQSRRSRTGLTS